MSLCRQSRVWTNSQFHISDKLRGKYWSTLTRGRDREGEEVKGEEEEEEGGGGPKKRWGNIRAFKPKFHWRQYSDITPIKAIVRISHWHSDDTNTIILSVLLQIPDSKQMWATSGNDAAPLAFLCPAQDVVEDVSLANVGLSLQSEIWRWTFNWPVW